MDANEFKRLNEGLKRRDKLRGKESLQDASADQASGYVSDVERRAQLVGESPQAIAAQDRALLRNPRPSSECFRAEQVMLATANLAKLSPPLRKHYDHCAYCRRMVAASRPDAKRFAELIDSLANAEQSEVIAPVAPSTRKSRVPSSVGYANRVFAWMDQYLRVAMVAFVPVLVIAVFSWKSLHLSRQSDPVAETPASREEVTAMKPAWDLEDKAWATQDATPEKATSEGPFPEDHAILQASADSGRRDDSTRTGSDVLGAVKKLLGLGSEQAPYDSENLAYVKGEEDEASPASAAVSASASDAASE